MNHRFRFLHVLFLILIGFSQAHANETTDENIEKLQTLFEKIITNQQQNYKDNQGQIIFDGNVTVEASGTYYAVTLPYMKIKHIDGKRTEIGFISINVSPGQQENQWKMAIAMPSPIITYDEKNQQTTRITIEQQHTVGIWQDDIQNFIKVDLKYNNVTFENASPRYSANIASIQTLQDFNKDEAGLWSGPAMIALKGVRIDAPDKMTKTNIDEIKASFMFDKFNYEYQKKSPDKEIDKGIDKANGNDTPKFGLFLDGFMNTGNGLNSQYSVSGIHHTRKSQSAEKPDTILTLDNVRFDIGIDNLLSNAGTITTLSSFNKLDISPKPKEYENITPSDLKIDLTLRNIPFTKIIELGKQTLQSTAQQPEMAKFAGMSALMSVPALLTQAETYLEIKDNFFSGKAYKVNFNGIVRADADAANSATAEIKASLHGLDKILAQTQMLSSNNEGKYVNQFRSLNKILEKIKLFAKVETSEDNTFIHFINVVMNKDSEILLNDKNLTTGSETKENEPAESIE